MADIHQNGIRASLSSILNSGKYSDMTICCGGREFMVHRAVVCPRSRFFAAACDGEFQVPSVHECTGDRGTLKVLGINYKKDLVR